MSNIHQRIKQKRKERKLTQQQLADAMGINRVSISQWESGETTPKGENLYVLCLNLKCQPGWLLYGNKQPKREPSADWAGFVSSWDDNSELDDDQVEIPFYAEVEVSAGSGRYAVEEVKEKKLIFSKTSLRKHGVPNNSAACVHVSGNSMEPKFEDGSTIAYDTSKTNIIDGDIYVIEQDNMLRIKYLYRTPRGGIRMKSENSCEHPDEIYQSKECEEIKILGRVFWYSVMF